MTNKNTKKLPKSGMLFKFWIWWFVNLKSVQKFHLFILDVFWFGSQNCLIIFVTIFGNYSHSEYCPDSWKMLLRAHWVRTKSWLLFEESFVPFASKSVGQIFFVEQEIESSSLVQDSLVDYDQNSKSKPRKTTLIKTIKISLIFSQTVSIFNEFIPTFVFYGSSEISRD